MATLKNIENKILMSEYKNSQAFILKLSNTDKEKAKTIIKEESSYLVLVLYIILVLFISITLIIILLGDKYNPNNISNKFKDDTNKKITFWDKLYYLIFGRHIINNFESNTKHLKCSKTDYLSNNLNKNNSSYSRYDKYNYLESFYNVLSTNNKTENTINKYYSSCNNNDYLTQFEESRKCLLNANNNSPCNNLNKNNTYGCNDKYSYLELDVD